MAKSKEAPYEVSAEDLIFDQRNANLGTEKGRQMLNTSLAKVGAGRGISITSDNVIMAGNKTLEQAIELGLKVKAVETDGDTLIAIKRMDLVSTDEKAVQLAILDNRVSEVSLNIDADVLIDLSESYDLSDAYSQEEIEELSQQEFKEHDEGTVAGVSQVVVFKVTVPLGSAELVEESLEQLKESYGEDDIEITRKG